MNLLSNLKDSVVDSIDRWAETPYKEEEEEGVNPIGYVQDIYNDIDSVFKNIYQITRNGFVVVKNLPSLGCKLSKGDEEFLCNDEDDTNFMCNLAKKKKKVICGVTNYIDPFTIVERLKNMVTGSNNSQEGGKLPKFNPRYLKNVKTNNLINSKKPPVNNTMGVKLKKRI